MPRKGYLVSVRGKQKKVVGYKRGKTWPPPQTFFESGPVGFTYFVVLWFRYYFSEYISKTMDQLETQIGVLQLDHTSVSNTSGRDAGSGPSARSPREATPNTNGDFVDRYGHAWAADTYLMKEQFDVSEMTDEWVRHTNDRLFKGLTPRERWILQMVFLQEYNWTQIAGMVRCSTQTIRVQYDEIIQYLRGHAGVLENAA